MAKLTGLREAVSAARQHTGNGFSFTRRVIALTAVFSIVALPLIAGAIFPGMPVTYGWQEQQGGFMFFTSAKDLMQYSTSYGITILPFHKHLIMAVAGLYFGHSVVK